jgi:hypothetical protein
MSNYLKFTDFSKLAIGLNIEGCRPTLNIPKNCDWYNVILAVDEPMAGITFDDVMKKVKDNNYEYIEQAIDFFDVENYIEQMVTIIERIKNNNNYKNILIHVHQYTGTTILDKTIEKKTNIKTILDTTNFFSSPTDYNKDYPDIDCLVSISQCASVTTNCKAGTIIVPDYFMDYDVAKNVVYTNKKTVSNNIDKYMDGIKFSRGGILVVNDLWNPTDYQIKNEGVFLID